MSNWLPFFIVVSVINLFVHYPNRVLDKSIQYILGVFTAVEFMRLIYGN